MDSQKLKAGSKLDALVAEKVMGYRVVDGPHHLKDCGCQPDQLHSAPGTRWLKEYSKDIAAAWEVVKKMKSIWGKKFRLSFDNGEWELEPAWNSPVCGYGKTPALAICRAALLAVERRS